MTIPLALVDGSRQVATTIEKVRRDHRERYAWAARRLAGLNVVDAGCGIGYGSAMLAQADCKVRAFDGSEETIQFAKQHFNHDARIEYGVGDLRDVSFPVGYDAVVCFEALEHLSQPERALRRFHGMAPRLVVSVPNQDVFPYRGYQHHFRHYTKAELTALLASNGWRAVEWYGQEDHEAAVLPDVNGRTLVAVCERIELAPLPRSLTIDDVRASHYLKGKAPQSVAIVAMGASKASYTTDASQAGGRHKLVDEVWAINNMGGVVQCDRVFHMDDLKLQEQRAANGKTDVGHMLEWIKRGDVPVYTSRRYEDYPSSVEYPLAFVLDAVAKDLYFNSTTAYAPALAIALGVKRIHFYGCDFSYADNPHKRERGRGCLEYWIGLANAKDIEIVLPPDTPLMDSNVPGSRLYGYDTEYISLDNRPNEPVTIVRVPKHPDDLPTADQMEQRYSHNPKTDGAS